MRLGSCGETTERAAARAHLLISVLYGVAALALTGALAVDWALFAWHRASVRTHLRRALGAGE